MFPLQDYIICLQGNNPKFRRKKDFPNEVKAWEQNNHNSNHIKSKDKDSPYE